jgi:diacylglycerol O-acyltransferase-1
MVAAQQAKSTVARLRKQQTNGTNSPLQRESQRSFQLTWYIIGAAHFINVTLNLVISTYMVYFKIFHPAVGMAVELHAVIVWLKVCSYALTNRDLRHSLLNPDINEALPPLYATCPYPQNITLGNICYFWWAPTLIYQPVYPRTERVRRSFVIKRAAEGISLCIVVWFTVMQYASPLLRNSVGQVHTLDFVSIAERVLKLSTISLFCWLCGFYALFHSFLNFLAEILRFADREFYSDWWNVSSVRVYWTSWNKPVYHFMRRHMYAPMIGRGMKPAVAQFGVFIFSGILHELLIGIPTHNFSGTLFFLIPSTIS